MRALALAVLGLMACNSTPPPVVADPHLHVQETTVVANGLAPEVMLVLDTSAAMAPQLDALRSTLEPFLSAHAATAVWGLTRFPAAAKPACADSAFDALAPIPATDNETSQLQAQTAQVVSAVDGLTAAGERDIGATLNGLSFISPDRDHFALLITSGDDACGVSLVDTVKGLRHNNIRTIVFAFGPSAVPLDDAAVAGGFQAVCPNGTDAECGSNNTCEVATGVCAHASFVVPDAASLGAELNQITAVVPGGSRCDYQLETVPSSINRISVTIDSAPSAPGPDTWALNGSKIHFQGALCGFLSESTVYTPVDVKVVVDDRP